MRKIKKIFIAALILYAGILLPTAGQAAKAPYGLEETAGAAGLNQVGGENAGDVTKLAGQVIGTALSMIGLLFFILMIYAGLRWMTARGNSELTEKAMDTMTAAAMGMIIVLSAYAITKFVFSAVPGTQIETCSTEAPEYQCVADPSSCQTGEILANSSPPICESGRVCCKPN
ncbi:MAG: hypothetical protein AAB408_04280 [Patescibacteria group bacterium]